MIFDLSKARIFLRPGTTDLRKAVNGLSVIVQEDIKQDPFSGSVFLFCNRERKLLKAVYWDKTGFRLSHRIQRIRKGLRRIVFPGLVMKPQHES